jgi:hypothetical protein
VIKINLSPKNKGQVLIIALAAMMVLFVITIVVIESGNLIYEKIHMQNIADSGAMEAGLWYARGLNILSLSNKILLCAGGIAGIITAVYPPAATKAKKIPEIVQKLQDAFAGTGDFAKWKVKPGPLVAAMLVVRNGWENGVIDLPIFNTEDFSENGFNPSFNVDRTYISDVENKNVTYYIKSKCDKQTYTFRGPARKVYYTNGGKSWQLIKPECYTACGQTYCGPLFVSRKVERKVKSIKLIPLTIEETGEHSVLVVSIKTNVKQLLSSGFLKNKNGDEIKPAVFISTAMTTIDGGSMDIWDINGAGYTPKIRHIILPQIQQLKILEKLQDYIKYINKLSGQASNDVLLH